MAHMHNVIDSDNRFIINPITRAIKNGSEKNKLVQGDHNAECFTFEIPRFVDGHDMSLCNKIEIHYTNISTNKEQSAGVYLVSDLAVDEWDDDKVVFSWLISGNATQFAGSLNFLIRFVCLTGETIDYAWHTNIYGGITVSDGMNNGEAVIAEYSDVLEAWKAEAIAEIETEKEAAINAIEEKGNEKLAEIDEKLILETDIVQETGDSETAVMSQKAVTELINRDLKFIDNGEGNITALINGADIAITDDGEGNIVMEV